MAAQAGQDAGRDHLEDAAQRVARVRGLADGRLHLRLGLGVGAGQIAGARALAQLLGRNLEEGRADRADGHHVGEHVDPGGAEELAAHRAHGGARRGLSGAGALQHVAQIVPVVLHPAGEVGVTGARSRERLGGRGKGGRRHAVEPVGVVAVEDGERDG